jgi:hypothetical protein
MSEGGSSFVNIRVHSWSDLGSDNWDLQPGALLFGLQCGVHHGLASGAILEAGGGVPFVQDGVDEFVVLVVAEGLDGVTGFGVARGAGDFEEFIGDWDGLEAGAASFADLELVGFVELVDESAL